MIDSDRWSIFPVNLMLGVLYLAVTSGSDGIGIWFYREYRNRDILYIQSKYYPILY